MQDLAKQEQFEMEVLDRLNSIKALNRLVFVGGTMLRLCHGLNRFSVDLDFWMTGKDAKKALFKELKEYLGGFYTLRDSADKYPTILFELKSNKYPRALKIEIRKKAGKIAAEQVIAFSRYSNAQVLVKAITLEEMMKAKTESLIGRREIRDAFDMEFLIKKGIKPAVDGQTAGKVLRAIESFTRKDYTVKLGSILDKEQRAYYTKENFKILTGLLRNVK